MIPKFQRRVKKSCRLLKLRYFSLKNGQSTMVKLIIVMWLLDASFEYHFCGQIEQLEALIKPEICIGNHMISRAIWNK